MFRLPEYLHWCTSVPFGISLCIVGLSANMISIIVWVNIYFYKMSSKKTKTTATYLISLALADSFLLLWFMIKDSLQLLFPRIIKTYEFAWFYSFIAFPIFFFAVFYSIWLVVIVTMDRYLLISRNYNGDTWTTLTCLFTLAVFGFVINFPHFFNYRPTLVTDETNATYYTYKATRYGLSWECGQYEFWLHCMLIVMIPWFAVAFMNILIIRVIWISSKKVKLAISTSSKSGQTGANSRTNQDRQITYLLLVVTFIFLILTAWQCINQCFWMLRIGMEGDGSVWDQVDGAYAFAKMAAIINSSINCILYCSFGTLFRTEFLRLWREFRSRSCCKKKKTFEIPPHDFVT